MAVCRRLRRSRIQVPILLLTARDTVANRVEGLDASADDYLVKPFAFAELAARLRALAQRAPETRDIIFATGEVRLDPAARRVWRGNAEIDPPTRNEAFTRQCQQETWFGERPDPAFAAKRGPS